MTDFRNFFNTVFSKELRNKNLSKFSPHLKSVATLPCETWNVKCVDIQQRHIQFKTDTKCQVTVLTLSSSLFYIRCSKWPPFARTQVVSRTCHWSIASSMTFCPMLCHTLNRRWHSSSTSFILRISRRPAVALQPRSYNPQGSYLGCLGATGREKWSLASLGVKVWLCHTVTRPVHRCAVLLEYEIVTFLDTWQQLLLQQYFTIIVAVHFHSKLHKNNSLHPSFDTATDTIMLVLNVGRSRAHLTFQVSQGSAATDLRWGENFNKFLFRNSFLNIAVKKLQKSVNIC